MNMHPGHWWLAPVYILLLRKESTSEICQEMDGKIFNVKDGIPGDNVPPLHPNCRSTIVPYSKWYEPETRLYRDPQDGKNKYAYNLSFGDWARNIGEPSLVYRADREPTLPTLDGAKFNKYLADEENMLPENYDFVKLYYVQNALDKNFTKGSITYFIL